MALLAICPERALTPLEEIRDAIIVVDGRRIVAVGRRGELRLPPGAQKYSAPGITVVPGFVDVHIHGAGGHDVMESTPEALGAVAASVARRGTTSLVATTVTASTEHICRAAQRIARYIARQPARRGWSWGWGTRTRLTPRLAPRSRRARDTQCTSSTPCALFPIGRLACSAQC